MAGKGLGERYRQQPRLSPAQEAKQAGTVSGVPELVLSGVDTVPTIADTEAVKSPELLEFESKLSTLPKELQDAYSRGGAEAYNAAVEQYNARIDQTQQAAPATSEVTQISPELLSRQKELQDAIDLSEKVKSGEVTLDDSEFDIQAYWDSVEYVRQKLALVNEAIEVERGNLTVQDKEAYDKYVTMAISPLTTHDASGNINVDFDTAKKLGMSDADIEEKWGVDLNAPAYKIPDDIYQDYLKNKDRYKDFNKQAPAFYVLTHAGYVTAIPFADPTKQITVKTLPGKHIVWKRVNDMPVIDKIVTGDREHSKTILKASPDGGFYLDDVYMAVKMKKLTPQDAISLIGEDAWREASKHNKALSSLGVYSADGKEYTIDALAQAIRDGKIEDVRAAGFLPEDVVEAQILASNKAPRTRAADQPVLTEYAPQVTGITTKTSSQLEQQMLKKVYDYERRHPAQTAIWGKTVLKYPDGTFGRIYGTGSPVAATLSPVGLTVVGVAAILATAGIAISPEIRGSISQAISNYKKVYGRAPTAEELIVSTNLGISSLADVATVSAAEKTANMTPLPQSLVSVGTTLVPPRIETPTLTTIPAAIPVMRGTTLVPPTLPRSGSETIPARIPISRGTTLVPPRIDIPTMIQAVATAGGAVTTDWAAWAQRAGVPGWTITPGGQSSFAPPTRRTSSYTPAKPYTVKSTEPGALPYWWNIRNTGRLTSYIRGADLAELDKIILDGYTAGSISQAELEDYKIARDNYVKAKGAAESAISSQVPALPETGLSKQVIAAAVLLAVTVILEMGLITDDSRTAAQRAIATELDMDTDSKTVTKLTDIAIRQAESVLSQSVTSTADAVKELPAEQTATQQAVTPAVETQATTAQAVSTADAARTATRTDVAVRPVTREATREAPAEAVKEAVREATMTSISTPPKPPPLPSGSGDGAGDVDIPPGSVAFKSGLFWKYVPPPWNQSKPITLGKGQTPRGADTSGGNSPYTTVQMIGRANARVPKLISIDAGVVDIFIEHGRDIRFSGGGTRTDVGTRLPSTTQGMSVDDIGGGVSRPDMTDVYPEHSVSRTAISAGEVSRPVRGVNRPEIAQRTRELTDGIETDSATINIRSRKTKELKKVKKSKGENDFSDLTSLSDEDVSDLFGVGDLLDTEPRGVNRTRHSKKAKNRKGRKEDDFSDLTTVGRIR
ncbi:MAG: hypothetical protein PHQ43_05355 [Dehalococcoidales bacterium]|nr:hypothetical protein [Dehalococcoidales bacterium]